jgi:hypothetical protein
MTTKGLMLPDLYDSCSKNSDKPLLSSHIPFIRLCNLLSVADTTGAAGDR